MTSAATQPSGNAKTIDRRGAASGMTAYVVWGLLTIYWKALKEYSPIELIGYRVVLSVLLLALIMAWRGRLLPLIVDIRDRRLTKPVALASIVLLVNWTSYVIVVSEGHVIEAALGYFISPLGAMLVGVKVLGEQLQPVQRLTALLGLSSVVVLTFSYGRIPVYALLIAASWTTYGYLKRQIPLSPIEGLTIETIVITVPALALIGWHLQYADSVVRTAGAVDWVLIAFLGVITAIPLMMFAYAAQRIPMTVIGPMQYSVPVINFLLGWLAYDETLTPSRVVGFSLVWIALVALTIDTVRRARRPIATNEELY